MDLKDCALSLIIFLGQPNLAKIFSSKKLITTESVAFLVGIDSTHLENNQWQLVSICVGHWIEGESLQ